MCENPALSQLKASVFVITYGRSGSTLIQNLINALPGHLLRGENTMMLAHFVRAWHELRHSVNRANILRLCARNDAPSAPHQPWFGYETLDPDALGQAMAALFVTQVLQPSPEIGRAHV